MEMNEDDRRVQAIQNLISEIQSENKMILDNLSEISSRINEIETLVLKSLSSEDDG